MKGNMKFKIIKNKLLTSCVCVSLCLFCLAGCNGSSGNTNDNTSNTGNSQTASTTGNMQNVSADSKLKDEDTDNSWDAASSTIIALNGSSAEISGNGATVSGGTVTITAAGTYVVSGTLTRGQILINASDNDLVRLVLNGADITAEKNAAIYAAVADKLVIILADGTTNSVTDVTSYTYADTEKEEPDAAIFSKCDLSVNGSGVLAVKGSFNNGIGTKDDLVIAGGNITVTAENDTLRGKDSVTILDGTFDLTTSNGDGIQANDSTDADKGWILLEGGVYNIKSGRDGIQAETILSISGGTFTIESGEGSGSSGTESYKGLKSAGDMSISGGSFTINSVDDSIHSNGNITIGYGDFTLSSGDDGIHSDNELNIKGGKIDITKSYEGLEGATVVISGGTADITASDDGVNAAGGNDGGVGGRFGKDKFASSGSYYINVSGGTVTLTAGGDGFDSNGDINISGGTVTSFIKSSADNGAMDCDGTFTATGGTIIYGGTGIGSVPGGNSTQSYVYVSSGIPANAEITVKEGSKSLVAFTPSISCQYLIVSSPDITSGESYKVYNGSSVLATVTAGTGGNTGGMGGPGGNRPGR